MYKRQVVQGVGAASSNVVAGYLVAHYGYPVTYLLHGSFALLALAALLPALAGARAKSSAPCDLTP